MSKKKINKSTRIKSQKICSSIWSITKWFDNHQWSITCSLILKKSGKEKRLINLNILPLTSCCCIFQHSFQNCCIPMVVSIRKFSELYFHFYFKLFLLISKFSILFFFLKKWNIKNICCMIAIMIFGRLIIIWW